LDSIVEVGQPLYTIHAQAPGELNYALEYAVGNANLYEVIEP
jgi:thymidine phosphorylase